MANSQAAFPLVGGMLPEYCQRLKDLPPCEFWIHEKKLAELLKLPRGHKHGPSEVLTCVIACLKKGFGGSKKARTMVSTSFDMVDLSVEGNSFGVCYQKWGDHEQFDRGTLNNEPLLRCPRW